MLKTFGNLHLWVLYGAVVLVALLAGYLLATPTDMSSLLPLGLLMLALVAPLLFRFHHEMLIASWNASFIVFFLPGRPSLAMLLAAVSLFVAALHRAMLKQPMFLPVKPVMLPLLLLGMIMLVTAIATGGIGGRALGTSSFGLSRYVAAFFGVAGFFALVTRAVPEERVWWVAALFVLGTITAGLGDLAYLTGINAAFLLVDSSLVSTLAAAETGGTMTRYIGLCWAGWAMFSFLLMRYGLAGLFDLSRPWRAAGAMTALAITLIGGFRSHIILTAMLFGTLFFLERLYRTRAVIILAVVVTLAGAALLSNADRLPLNVQRAISFLPIEVDHVARQDAQGTLDWRLEMWEVVVKDIPKYFWLGKGFTYSGTDYMLTLEAMRRGLLHKSYEFALISGNYHHGILTLIIPFGIWGLLAFLWFVTASFRALLANYRFGNPSLKLINRYLLAVFVVRLVFFLTLYGQFDLDLPMFAGIIGLSLSLNGGIRSAASQPLPARAPQPASGRLSAQPSFS
ncbi:MAG: O-antigen ligase family protein [Limisphaerales bacterium]